MRPGIRDAVMAPATPRIIAWKPGGIMALIAPVTPLEEMASLIL